MLLRRLGQSDIQITPMGLGCWQFSKAGGMASFFWPDLPDDEIRRIVEVSLAGGINWFDSAEAYGKGQSEAALSRALEALGKRDGEVVVATKWMPTLRTAGSILATIDDRLRFLDGFGIDLHQVHNPYAILSTHRAQMDAMAQLVKAGKIKSVGISNFSAAAMRACHAHLARHDIPLVSNQINYSLLKRSADANGVMATAKELGITIIAYSPLAQGLLTGKFHDDTQLIKQRPGPRKWMSAYKQQGLQKSRPVIEELRKVADEVGASPAQVALAWCMRFHGDSVVVIPGATTVKQAADNARAMQVELGEAQLQRLDQVSRAFM